MLRQLSPRGNALQEHARNDEVGADEVRHDYSTTADNQTSLGL